VLAYCTALGLNEVVNAGVVIRAHTLNLAAEPATLLSEVNRLAATIAADSTSGPRPAGCALVL